MFVTDGRIGRLVPVAVVVSIVVVGLVFVLAGHWLRGAAILGAAAGVGAILRLCIPERAIGPLRVRGRAFDVFFLGALALVFTLATTISMV